MPLNEANRHKSVLAMGIFVTPLYRLIPETLSPEVYQRNIYVIYKCLLCSVRAKYLHLSRVRGWEGGGGCLGSGQWKDATRVCHLNLWPWQETHPKGFSLLSTVRLRNVGTWKHIIWSQLFLFPLFYKWRNLAMYLTLRLIIFHLFFLITPFSSNQVRKFLS